MQKNYNVNEARRIFADSKQYPLIELIGYYNLMLKVFGNTREIETKGILITELNIVILGLKEREQEILRQIYWDQVSAAEAGRCFGFTRERARQVEEDAIRAIRENTGRFVIKEIVLNLDVEINETIKWLRAKQNWLNSIKSKREFKCDIPIKELINDTRVVNAMHKSGLKTVGDIVYLSEEEFLAIKGFNKAGFEKIISQMQLYFPGWVPNASKRKDLASTNVYGLEDISIKFYDVKVEKLNFSNRAYNCLMRAGIYTIGELFEASYQELAAVRYLGEKVLHEINRKKDFVYLASQPIRKQKMMPLDEETICLVETMRISNLGEIALLDDPECVVYDLQEIKQRLLSEYL